MSAIGSFQIVPAESLDKLEATSSSAELFASINHFQTASMDFEYDGYV